jgi:hypothetical protein
LCIPESDIVVCGGGVCDLLVNSCEGIVAEISATTKTLLSESIFTDEA